MKSFRDLNRPVVQEGENNQVKDGDPCWTGYQMVGMKNKGGKKVPNCVPTKEEVVQEGRPSQRHPLEGHEYHKKSNEALIHIAKDAHEAAEAMKSHNTTAENKYRDQANDSATVRYFRQKNGMPEWYKKKYGHIKEAKDEQEYGYEGDMALNQLATLTRCAEMIKDLLKPDTDMPEWVQSKITLATDYIQTAADYMHSEMKEEVVVEASYKDTRGTLKDRLAGEVLNFHSMHDRIPSTSEFGRAVKSKPKQQAISHAKKLLGMQVKEKVDLEEGKWNYPPEYTKKANADDEDELKVSLINKDLRKEWRKKQKAKDHKNLMAGMKKEEVEPIEELSKDTLKRYIPTAAADLSKKGISAGIDARSGKVGATKEYGDHFEKRYRGIIKATRKLAKEEAEQIDEAWSDNEKLNNAHDVLKKHGYDYADTSNFGKQNEKHYYDGLHKGTNTLHRVTVHPNGSWTAHTNTKSERSNSRNINDLHSKITGHGSDEQSLSKHISNWHNEKSHPIKTALKKVFNREQSEQIDEFIVVNFTDAELNEVKKVPYTPPNEDWKQHKKVMSKSGAHIGTVSIRPKTGLVGLLGTHQAHYHPDGPNSDYSGKHHELDDTHSNTSDAVKAIKRMHKEHRAAAKREMDRTTKMYKVIPEEVSKTTANMPADIGTPAQLSLRVTPKKLETPVYESRQLQIVREAMADAKKKDAAKKNEKKVSPAGNDKFQSEPELTSSITKNT
jgi:hypothetical protein